MFGKYKEHNLKNFLTETKYVKVKGFEFIIKKINASNYLEGTKIMLQSYDTYTNAKAGSNETASYSKILDHYGDIICAAVVSPKIVRKESEDPKEIWLDLLFNDMELVTGLYEEIITHTYGKKKRYWWQKRESRISNF